MPQKKTKVQRYLIGADLLLSTNWLVTKVF